MNSVTGFSNVPQNLYVQGLWEGAYVLSPLSEKARKMSLQRQYFLLFILRPRVLIQLGFEPLAEPLASRLADWSLSS